MVQYIFLIYGAFTFLFGILFFFAMPDSPSTAWFFNAEERKLAAIRLAPNQTGIESRKVRRLLTAKKYMLMSPRNSSASKSGKPSRTQNAT